jgi:LPXTG-motif cell wall-anchored protein
MESSQIYISIAILSLLIIGIIFLFVRKNRKKKQITPLTAIAFGFVIAGIVFGDDRLTSYSLMGFGVLLAVVDIIIKIKKNK